MLVLDTYWKTRYSMVSEHTCTIDYEMDQIMWQTTISFDLLHSSHKWIQTILSCGKHCQAMQIGAVSRLRFWQEILRIQNIHQVEHCAFSEVIRLFQLAGCVRNKLQFRTAQQNQRSFPWTEDWGWTVYPHLICGIWLFKFLETRLRTMIERGDSLLNKRKACSPPHTIHKRKQSQRVINDLDNVDFIPSNVQSSHQEALLYVFEDNEAVIKMIIKGSPTMRHVSRTHRVALDWLFDRINLDPKIQIKYIDTKNQLADILTKGNFTRDEWNHLLYLFNISHFSSTECSEVMSKRTQKDAGVERVTAKSKPMMNLVSRCSARNPNVLLSTASESPVKTRHESQSSLSLQTEKYNRTVRPVVHAHSSSYSEWNVDKTWSSQEWKSDELIHIILAQGEWSSAEEAKQILKKCNKRQGTTFCDMENVYVFYNASICTHGKNYSDNWHSIKNTEDLTMKQMFDISEKLISEQSDEINGISTINWEHSSWKYLSLVGDEQVISLLHTKVYVRILRFCIVPWKDEREPTIKLCMGRQIDVVQKFIRIQNFGQNWWWTNGIRVEYLPRIHHIAVLPQSPKVHEQNGRTRTIPRTNYLHLDVQRHHMGI